MGRSSTISCFKIMTCGRDSVDNADLDLPEGKASTEKRGWSFNKKSGRHRVLSNSVVLELPSAGSKESVESSSNDFQEQANFTVAEKTSVAEAAQQADETPNFTSAEVNSELASTVTPAVVNGTENDCGSNLDLPESVAILIQAAIRGYLVQRVLIKYKSVIKLQAAVRGHLVRRQAVGTLRCVQAIVKMQALIRARRVRQQLASQERLGDKNEMNGRSTNSVGKENSVTEENRKCSSLKKLLATKFAQQLLESIPKTKKIYITCDPSKADSSWKWLERWMSASSVDIAQPPKPHTDLDHEVQGHSKLVTPGVGAKLQVDIISESLGLKSVYDGAEIPLKGEDLLVTKDAGDFEFQPFEQTVILSNSSSAALADETPQLQGKISSTPIEGDMEELVADETKNDMEQSQLVDVDSKQEVSADIESVANEASDSLSEQSPGHPDEPLELVHGDVSGKLEAGRENSKLTMKRVASEQLETEGKKFIFGSRKSTNPVFAAVQSKFEELSSTAASGRPISSTHRETAMESKSDTHLPQMDSMLQTKDLSQTEDFSSHDPEGHIGGSDYGTKNTSTSTVDTLDRSEVGGDSTHYAGAASRGDSFPSASVDSLSNHRTFDTEADKPTSMSETQQVPSDSRVHDSYEGDVFGKSLTDTGTNAHSYALERQRPSASVEPPLENSMLDMQMDRVTEEVVDSLLQGGSPRSHVMVPESCGTPSSQVSVNVKGEKSDSSMRNQKRKSNSGGKKSPLQQDNDSAVRNSMEHLPKDSKNGKRRNSFDYDLKVGSNSSIPNYMQATESARAKIHANCSPRLSPDLQDKDIHIKKRHSLPGTNGKQGSPRMQRSMSQAQQCVKGNGTHSPNTTERRWQR